ncbi:STAS domain-containing protein [Streptomyces racemochromogenes]|uniref:Anti-sigma factor antagonist n=1 Tax=Streptomyces racemochromogenes TaxID=67353 RepID=A0ABW7PPJ1_9ACTN
MTSGKDRTGRPAARSAEPHAVHVSGEMDLGHAEQLRAMLKAALDEAPDGADIVVDLRDSSFCDSSGLNVLLATQQRARAARHRLVLAAPSHQMVRVLELTGSTGLFTLVPAPPS